MAKQDQIRAKLASKIFTPYGKTVTLKSKSSPVYNTRGELEDVTDTQSSISIVPYNIISSERFYESFGEMDTGDVEAAIPYTVTVAIGDEIVMEGDTYTIIRVEKNYLPDNVVTIVRLSKNTA